MITTAERARPSIPSQCVQPRLGRLIKRHPTMVSGIVLLGLMVLMAVGAPYWGTLDPLELNPIERLYAPSTQHWFGTDMLGRDLYKQNPRSLRRNPLPVKRIYWSLLVGHEHMARALIELMQIGKTPSGADRVLHHAPEAFDRVEVVPTMGR